MKKSIMGLMVLLGFCLLFFHCQKQERADMVIKNGKVFSVSEKNPQTQAVAVKRGKIIALGTDEEIEKFIGPSTQVLDVKEKLVILGFNDAHCHFAGGGVA